MNEEILLEVKPKYIWWLRALTKMCDILLYLGILAILSFFILATSDFDSFATNFIVGVSITFVILATILLYIRLFIDKKNFEATKYKLYEDRIEFEEGFINHKYTTIQLKDIKEIHLEQNLFQRKAELGSIRFVTPANNSTVNTGIYFTDIENSKYVYAKVKEIHEKVK